ncbi:hypothetical protein D3C71_1484080 [compost metagenome]
MPGLLSTSLIVPLSPANTFTAAPIVTLLPLEVDTPLLAGFWKPLLVTVAVSPGSPSIQAFANVRVARRRVLVWVQVMAVSSGETVSAPPLSGSVLPAQVSTAS